MSEPRQRIWRRPKSCADRNAFHTFRVGFLIFLVLWFVLPVVMP